VIIPVYNEEKTIQEIIRRVRDVDIPKEIIVVDDASTDGTLKQIEAVRGKDLRLIRLPKNSGKGAALHEGIRQARNDVVLIQDADLEYDPADYADLLMPFAKGVADVVYGSRFLTTKSRRVLFFWHSVMNTGLTFLSNMFTNLNLTDMETCYKAFGRELIQSLTLNEKRFGFEPEVTIKLARRRVRFFEVGISYNGRSYAEGKKIGTKDAVRALYCIFRYGLFSGRS
jgi:glycosyltransferase involved in cell wall biosynthesis